MTEETLITEYKSLQKIRTGDKGFRDLSVTCVGLANAQGGVIAIGLIARNKKILSTQLTKMLQLTEEDRLRNYTSRLVETGILIKRGNKKANEFLVNPKLISNALINVKTSLKTIEPHSLRALILEDLRLFPNSKRKEIQERLPDVDPGDVQKQIYKLIEEGVVTSSGSKKTRVYKLA